VLSFPFPASLQQSTGLTTCDAYPQLHRLFACLHAVEPWKGQFFRVALEARTKRTNHWLRVHQPPSCHRNQPPQAFHQAKSEWKWFRTTRRLFLVQQRKSETVQPNGSIVTRRYQSSQSIKIQAVASLSPDGRFWVTSKINSVSVLVASRGPSPGTSSGHSAFQFQDWESAMRLLMVALAIVDSS
jgi:hypothetical protein